MLGSAEIDRLMAVRPGDFLKIRFFLLLLVYQTFEASMKITGTINH